MDGQMIETNRTRMNFGMNAKGFVQLDVTVSYDTPEMSAEAARKALTEYKTICKEQGLKLADTGAA